jgi:hypothetical protein
MHPFLTSVTHIDIWVVRLTYVIVYFREYIAISYTNETFLCVGFQMKIDTHVSPCSLHTIWQFRQPAVPHKLEWKIEIFGLYVPHLK